MDSNRVENIKHTEIFKNMSLENFFKVVYDQSIEERQMAIETFSQFKKEIKGIEDIFMIGEKLDPFLSTAQKSTENLIKMVTAFQRILELETDKKSATEEVPDATQMIKLLDAMEVGPKRFVDSMNRIVHDVEEKSLVSDIQQNKKEDSFEELVLSKNGE